MKNFLLRMFRSILLFPQLRSLRAAWFFSGYGGNFILDKSLEFAWRNGSLKFPGKNISFDKHSIEKVSGRMFDLLVFSVKCFNLKKEEGSIIAEIPRGTQSVRIAVHTPQTLIAINEIFRDHTYDVYLNQELIIVDIGMNVGVASLFFASIPTTIKVYAFEPFRETYELAIKNLSLNPVLKQKIHPVLAGLGKEPGLRSFPKPYAGYMGASTTEFFIQDEVALHQSNDLEQVEIRNVSEELQRIKNAHDKMAIVLKIDCEGAEYEIIEDLSRTGVLHSVSYLMIEWHIKDKMQLISTLQEFDFRVFSPDKGGNALRGMIYAFK